MKLGASFWAALLAVCALSASARWILHDKTPGPDGHWTLSDPDSLYHARRVERTLFEGGWPASSDAFLNHPEGARIPWPPYYDGLAALCLRPFVGASAGGPGRAAIERAVGRLPLLFGLLTSLCAFLAARQLAGNLAGLTAGSLHALALGSIVYSRLGNGDHHAFLSLLGALLLWGFSHALSGERLRDPKRALGLGLALGACAGLALGSWVAALMLVVLLDLVFAVLLVMHARQPRPGLALFGLAFHLTCLFVLLPAILDSPWREPFPWMVVNLSWFQPGYLALGALVFVPLLALHPGGRVWRFYPLCVALALCGLALGSTILEDGPLEGIREGFAWVSRQNNFMSGIEESRPLFGAGHVPGGVHSYLGAFIWLLPAAWGMGLWHFLKHQRTELLPWIVALPPLALQAARQVRFSDGLIFSAAVLVSWFVIGGLPWHKVRAPRWLCVPLLVLLVGFSQSTTSARMWDVGGGALKDQRRKRASREMCDWIAAQETERPARAVLSTWNRGHEIEWAARRPSVATNFGSYVGEKGFLSPAHFFLERDAASAEALLQERDADLVLLTVDLSSALPGWIQAGPDEWKGEYFTLDERGQGRLRRPWFESIGGQLLNDGRVRTRPGEKRADSLNFLRRVHVSPLQLGASPISSWRGRTPYGWVWEHVRGARVRLQGEPQTPVTLEIELEYEAGPGKPLEPLLFRASAEFDAHGQAELRVPYATLEPNGDGRVVRAVWRTRSAEGPLPIAERDVREGLPVLILP